MLGVRLLVYGGRDFKDRRRLWSRLEEIDFSLCIDLIIQGKASGADDLAEEWAKARGCPFWGFPAQWDDIHREGAVVRRTKGGKLYDASAGSRRNRQMLEEGQPTHGLGMPGGSGTADMRQQAARWGVIDLT